MDEFWNVYDRYRNKTGKIIKRNFNERLQLGEYHLVTTAVIMNNNKILISRRNPKDIDSLNFNDGEVTEVKWVTEEEYIQMYLKQKIIPTGECIINLLKKERECER